MFFNGLINEPVGNNLTNRQEDIFTVKSALSELDRFDKEEMNGFITRPLDNAIKSYQADKGLKTDGLIFPGGETEQELQKEPRLQTLFQEEPYDPVHNPDGPMLPQAQNAFQSEQNPSFQTNTMNADESESTDDAASETIEKTSVEEAENIPEDSEDQNEQQNLTQVNEEAIIEQLIAEERAEKQNAVEVLTESKPLVFDATGRMIKSEIDVPLPKQKPIVPETARPSFDIQKAPVFNNGKIRQEILLNNDPAKFEIIDNPSLENPSLKEQSTQTIFKIESLGNRAVQKHSKNIEEIAKKHGVNPDLVKSVMWAENARGHKGGLNELADKLGRSNSQTPMNINGKIWGGLIDKPGQKLNNDQENIEAGVILLKRISDRIENPTPEKIGSIWHFTGRENVNEMGKEIGEAFRNKPWTKKK